MRCLAQPGTDGYIKIDSEGAQSLDKPHLNPGHRPHRISIGQFSVPVPQSRTPRIILGVALCIGGLLGFLPILGFWMLPLGLLLLSIDLKPVRRFRRRAEVWWGRKRQAKQKSKQKR